MKKITLFFISLLFAFSAKAQEVTITDLSQLDDNKAYFIESARCFLMYNTTANAYGVSTNNASRLANITIRADWEDNNQLFNIKKIGESYYLYSIGAAKYIDKEGNFTDNATDALTFVHIGGDHPWKLLIGGNGMNSQEPGARETGIAVDSWTTTDPGNCYKILDVEASTVVAVDYPNELTEFDQNKCYTISTKARGGWSVKYSDGEYMFCSTHDAFNTDHTVDVTKTENHFAVLTIDNENYYLYSVHAKKFVKADNTLVNGVADAIVLADASAIGDCRVQVYFRDIANKYINLGGEKQMAIDDWNKIDDGNAVAFIEVGDFDPTEALAMLSNSDASAIETVRNEDYANEIYDLTGRRIENITTPGIYIINGKKQLVK